MLVQLCKKNLMRLGPVASGRVLLAVKAAGGKFAPRDCLDRCPHCEQAAIAVVDGSLIGAGTAEELAAMFVASPAA